ncbi:MAG: hypothetical protein ACRERE_29045 [Candidatus Entotheonellia bacterium]
MKPGGEKPIPEAWGTGAEQSSGADRLQRMLVPRFRFRRQLTASVQRRGAPLNGSRVEL